MQQIFAKAAELSARALPERAEGDGYSEQSLIDIGQQAGLDAQVIRAAVRSLDVRADPPVRRAGLVVGVGRTVQLDRTLSDAEWQRLVVQLREDFGAVGTVSERGGLRQWSNGNLRVLVEPTERGDRVRMLTRNGAAQSYVTLGAGLAAAAAVGAVISGIAGALAEPGVIGPLAGLSGMAAASFAAAAFRLRGWADIRTRQMQRLAEQLIGLARPVD